MHLSTHSRRGVFAVALVAAAFGSSWLLGRALRPPSTTSAAHVRPIPDPAARRVTIPTLKLGGELPELRLPKPDTHAAPHRPTQRVRRTTQGDAPQRQQPAQPPAPLGDESQQAIPPTTPPAVAPPEPPRPAPRRSPRPSSPPRSAAPPPAPQAPQSAPPSATTPPPTTDGADSYDTADEGY
jgi:hypothetical protein